MMTRNLLRAGALSCALLTSTALTSPALAQSQQPSVFQHVDANGVDLVDGSFNFALEEGSIGAGDSRLAFTRTYGRAGWSDGIPGRLHRSLFSGNEQINLNFGNRVERFRLSGGTWVPEKADGATLTGSTSSYLYRSADGTEIEYAAPGRETMLAYNAGNGIAYCLDDSATECELLPISIKPPNGRRRDLHWKVAEICGDPDLINGTPCNWFPRLQSITNDAAYLVKLRYAENSYTSAGPSPDWFRRIGLRFVNTNVEACDPTADDCTLTQNWGQVTYAAPASGVTEVTDIGGRTWRFSGSSTSFAIRRPGSAADNVSVTRSSDGVVSAVTRDGVTTSYSRSASGSTGTMTVTDAASGETVITSDLNIGRPTSVTDPLGRTTSFQYDTSGRLTRTTAHEGNYVQYTLDARGNVTQTQAVAKPGSGVTTITTSATFPTTCTSQVTCNLPTSTTDARGNVTDYTYDPTHGGLLTVTAPAPTSGADRPQTRYSYTQTNGVHLLTGVSTCASGTSANCVGTADESRTVIGYTIGQPTSVEQRDGTGSLSAVTTTAYDRFGNVASADGPLSGTADTTHFRYNDARQLVGMISPDPDGGGALQHRAVRTTYSHGLPTKQEQGNVAGTSDSDWAGFSASQGVEIEYDTHQRPVVQRLTSGSTTYALTQTGYDSLGRLRCTAQRMNPAEFATASLPSDACTLDTDGSFGPDRIVRTSYDAAGQVVRQESGVGTSAQADEVVTTYTGNGRAETLTDGNGNRTSYEYDGQDRLLKTRFPSPTTAGVSSTTDYEQLGYDVAGNVTSRRLRDGNNIAFTYDALNRATLKDLPGSEPDVTFSYDLLGRMTGASQPGHALSFTYDAVGRNVTQAGPLGTVSSTWDAAGRRTRLTYPGAGLYVDYDYLTTGEMTHVRENGATSGVGVLATFAYDNLGRRTSFTRGNGTVTSYDYDAVSQLDELVQNLSGTASDLTLTFGHNPAGQIVSTTRSNDSYSFTGMTNQNVTDSHNGLNQVTATGSTGVSHDARGNTTAIGSAGYGYASENLMLSGPGTTLSYDPAMRLHQVTGSGTTRFAYDGVNLIAEYDGSSNLQRRHVHGPGADEPLVTYEGSGTSDRRFLHADERGSVVAHSDSSGAITGTVNRYDEYGAPQGTLTGRFGYTGQAWLPEIGMWYYKARIYNPGMGGPRFMQTDPIGHGDGMNLYAYVGGDPVNRSDPRGLTGCDFSDAAEGDILVCGERLERPSPQVQVRSIEAGMVGSAWRPAAIFDPCSGASLLDSLRCIADGGAMFSNVSYLDSSQNPILQNPYVLVRMTPGALRHIAIQHGSYAVNNKSVFLPERRNVSDLFSMFTYAIQRSIPTPSYNNTLVYSITYPRPVGWERGTGSLTYNVTVVAQFTGQFTSDGRRILNLVTMYPGLP